MESTESVLSRWLLLPAEELAISSIKTAPAYQPRAVGLAPYRDRARLERESEQHVARLAECATGGGQLDPLLVARIDGRLYVVDGHHRLRAYKRAGRRAVPARVLDLTHAQAVLVSKLVNCSGAKLALHAEQARECAWQVLAHLTRRGRNPLPAGVSVRSVGRTYGTSHETVRAMLRRLSTVKPCEYGQEACDPGTGWPQWRYVKGNAIRSRFTDVDDDARERHRDEKRAAKLADMIEKDGLAAFMRSLRLLGAEAMRDAEEIVSTLPDDSFAY